MPIEHEKPFQVICKCAEDQVLQFPSEKLCNNYLKRRCYRGKQCFYSHSNDNNAIRLIEWIEETKLELYICVYQIASTCLFESIERLVSNTNRVKVKLFTNKNDDLLNNQIENLNRLRNVQIKYSKLGKMMHNKFVIRDPSLEINRSVMTGSLNWTNSALFFNHENVLISTKPNTIASYKKIFDDLWTKGDFLEK